jgi:RNA polymerase sigma-70 factor (ECF subfamily)
MMPPAPTAPADLELDALYRRYGPTVRQALQRLGVDESGLDDAVQEVFVVLVRRIATFDRRRSMTNWLWGIARGVASTHRRGRRRRDRLHAALPPDAVSTSGSIPTPDDAVRLAEARALLDDFLGGLDRDKCAVFVMAEVEGRSGPEIARQLDVNLNTVYARLRAARQRWATTVERTHTAEGGQGWFRGVLASCWPAASSAASTTWIPAAAGTTLAAALVIPTAIAPRIELPHIAAAEPLQLADDPAPVHPPRFDRPFVARVRPQPAKEEGEPPPMAAEENEPMRLPAATLAVVITAAPAAASAAAPADDHTLRAEDNDQDADIAARTEDGSYIFENDYVDGESLSADGSILVARPSLRFQSMIDIRSHFIPELISKSYDL